MDDDGVVLAIQDAVQLFQRGVQGDFFEGVVSGLDDVVRRLDLALEQLALQAPERRHSFDLAVEGLRKR